MDENRLKTMIGNRIYDLRTEHELTQDEFTKRIGIYTTRGHLSKIERGIIMPSAEFIRAVCITFSISPEWILNIPYIKNVTLSSKELKLITLFNSIPKDSQNLIESLLEKLSSSSK